MESTNKAAAFLRLQKHPEWPIFKAHIEEIAEQHSKYSVGYVAKNNLVDAQRQAWIREGLLEAVDEVQSLIDYEKSFAGKVANVICKICGK